MAGLLDDAPQGGLLSAPPPSGGLLGDIVNWWRAQPSVLDQMRAAQAMRSNTGDGLADFRADAHNPALRNALLDLAGNFSFGGVMRGPYQSAPNALMGFRKIGPNVGFSESNFPHTQYVKVTLDNGETFVDAIKGMNKPHAIERAYRNWDAKDIEPITAEEAAKIDPALR